MCKGILLLILVLILSSVSVSANQGHIKLLATRDTATGTIGSEADLYLEISPGSGRIFLDTFPLTRLDTQISTRFAKQIACSFLDIDCNAYDFVYTIRSESAIIGGPSAGAALAVLTVSVLDNQKIDENVGITGSINSGGIIGSVGRIRQKIEIAQELGLKKVLIPAGERYISERVFYRINTTSGNTVDIVEYGKEIGINVVEVSTLNQALLEFTGKNYNDKELDIQINQDYAETMKNLASDLCQRSESLNKHAKKIFSNLSIIKDIENTTIKGLESFENQTYYSAASFCFSSNVRLTSFILSSQNLSEIEISKKVISVRKNVTDFDSLIDSREIKTISDLESYMIVKDRLLEAKDFLDLAGGSDSDSIHNLAFAIERLNSARAWSKFFDHRDKSIELDSESLRNSCVNKIGEAEERYQYINVLFPEAANADLRVDIDSAYDDFSNDNYALCLFKASTAKASINALINLIGADEDQFDNILDKKLEVVKENLAREEAKGVFPLIGYSYYEYANSLRNSQRFSSLLFSEYSLEFGNLDIYFPQSSKKPVIRNNLEPKTALIFFVGLLIGLSASLLIKYNKDTKKPRRKKH